MDEMGREIIITTQIDDYIKKKDALQKELLAAGKAYFEAKRKLAEASDFLKLTEAKLREEIASETITDPKDRNARIPRFKAQAAIDSELDLRRRGNPVMEKAQTIYNAVEEELNDAILKKEIFLREWQFLLEEINFVASIWDNAK